MNSPKGETNFYQLDEKLQMEEKIVQQILKFIENCCEQCNESFQHLFRCQSFSQSKNYVQINMLQEIIYFFIQIIKYKRSFFQVVIDSREQHCSFKFYNLLNQILTTLINLSNGINTENKMILLKNAPFLSKLNLLIEDIDLNILSTNLRDIKNIQTLLNSVLLIFTILLNTNEQEPLIQLIKIINLEKLAQIANFIYHKNFRHRLGYIYQVP